MNTKTNNIGATYQLSYENFLAFALKQGIAYKIIINGCGELLRVLMQSGRNIIIVASHIHNAKYFLIDKKTLIAKEVTISDFNNERLNPNFIKHATTLSLGSKTILNHSSKIGYLRITPSGFVEEVMYEF